MKLKKKNSGNKRWREFAKPCSLLLMKISYEVFVKAFYGSQSMLHGNSNVTLQMRNTSKGFWKLRERKKNDFYSDVMQHVSLNTPFFYEFFFRLYLWSVWRDRHLYYLFVADTFILIRSRYSSKTPMNEMGFTW